MGEILQNAPLLSAAGQVASGIGGAITSVINTNKTIKANKQLAEMAYQRDLDMWNRQNQYNSPVQQMERFKQAGLNPNLIYGQGSSGNASTLPKYQAPKVDYNYQPPMLGMAMANYQDAKIQQAKIDNLKATTSNIATKTVNEALRATSIRLEQDMQKLKNKYYSPEKEAVLRGIEARTGLTRQTQALQKYQTDAYGINNQTLAQMNQLRMGVLREQIRNARSAINERDSLLGGRLNLQGTQLRNEMIRGTKIGSEIANIDSRTDINEKEKELLKIQLIKEGINLKWMPWQKGVELLGDVLGGASDAISIFGGKKSMTVPYAGGTLTKSKNVWRAK